MIVPILMFKTAVPLFRDLTVDTTNMEVYPQACIRCLTIPQPTRSGLFRMTAFYTGESNDFWEGCVKQTLQVDLKLKLWCGQTFRIFAEILRLHFPGVVVS